MPHGITVYRTEPKTKKVEKKITQCYLPLGRGDIPPFTPAEAGTGCSDPGGIQDWVYLGTTVEVRSPCPMLHKPVAAWFLNLVIFQLGCDVISSCVLTRLGWRLQRSVAWSWKHRAMQSPQQRDPRPAQSRCGRSLLPGTEATRVFRRSRLYNDRQ